MNRRLDKRTDSVRANDRISATATTDRAKPAKTARTAHKTKRAEARAEATTGVSMDYQMGFTSGPSI
jgi:hypothetical protein